MSVSSQSNGLCSEGSGTLLTYEAQSQKRMNLTCDILALPNDRFDFVVEQAHPKGARTLVSTVFRFALARRALRHDGESEICAPG